MMQPAVLLLCVLNFALIGALPRIFFKRGALNASWWLTAAPLFSMAVLLLAGALQLVAARTAVLWPVSVIFAAASIALIACTIGVHRVPLALWHQEGDRADRLVTQGPYALVRHPFYTAFILALLAAVAAMPSPFTVMIALVGMIQLHRTAVREESHLGAQFGREYAVYMQRTGRFTPRVRRAVSYSKPWART